MIFLSLEKDEKYNFVYCGPGRWERNEFQEQLQYQEQVTLKIRIFFLFLRKLLNNKEKFIAF